jgi:formyl-CoA transferase
MRQQAPYPRFVDEPQEVPAGAPRLGEHTDEVLSTLVGLERSEVAALREKGIV